MNSKIYSISAALLLLFSPYALAVNPNPPKVFLLEPGGYGGRVLIKWAQNAADVEWYAVERLGTVGNKPVVLPAWIEVGRVKAREGLGGRDLEVVQTFGLPSEVPAPDNPAKYRVCAVQALQPGAWTPPPDLGSNVPGKKCSPATRYPQSLRQEVDQVSASSLTPQASSTLRTGTALKTTTSGSALTSANSQASSPTMTNKLKPGDALRANPLPTPPGAATINGSGALQSQPAPRPPRHICDAARDARARNSPAAPNLEAQCRASGGKP